MTAKKVYKVVNKGLNKYGLDVKLVEFNGLYNVTEVLENYQLGRMIKNRCLWFKQDTTLDVATKKFNSLVNTAI